MSPEHGYLEELVDSMLRQDLADRPQTIQEVKQALIARRNSFVVRQKISSLEGTTIPATELDDALVIDPPSLVGRDWEDGILTLRLSQPLNQKRVYAFQNMGNFRWHPDAPPEAFRFEGPNATVRARAGSQEH